MLSLRTKSSSFYAFQSTLVYSPYLDEVSDSAGRAVASKGDLIAIYPGTYYSPGEPLFWASLGNPFIFRCADGLLLDGNCRGTETVKRAIITVKASKLVIWNDGSL